MNSEDFQHVLQQAIAGDHDALEKVFDMYEPLINKHSYIGGRLDEDLRQYIMIHIALNISKFHI